MTETEFKPLFDKHATGIFKGDHSYNLSAVLSDTEQERIQLLAQGLGKPYEMFLGVFDEKNKFVGWSWGRQENASTFYMINSAILKRHRRKGLYGAVLARCIAILSKTGFQVIYSRHCATNNAIIIPKLKAGFLVSKMELDD